MVPVLSHSTAALGLDGEMWCYQKPDFEAQLITELQRQQQRSQFCDTLLKTEGTDAHRIAVDKESWLIMSINCVSINIYK